MGDTNVRRACLLVRGVCGWLVGVVGLLVLVGLSSSATRLEAAQTGEIRDCARLYEGRTYDDARLCFTGYIAAHPSDAAAAANLGRTYLAQRQVPLALDWLKKAVALDPQRSDYHDWLGQAYGIAAERGPVVRQFGLAVKVRREFERAVALDPENLDAREDLIQFLIQAPTFIGGSFEQARAQAAELARRDPLRGRLARAEIAMRQLPPPAAEREVQAMAADFPGDARPRLTLADLYAKTGRADQAFDALEAALRIEPMNADAHFAFARLATASGQRLDRAQELLGAYLAHLPAGDCADEADAHFELANLLRRKGEVGRAREQLQATLRLDPGQGAAREALRRLDRTAPAP